jgi:predicted CXXCH cytochrome family protein
VQTNKQTITKIKWVVSLALLVVLAALVANWNAVQVEGAAQTAETAAPTSQETPHEAPILARPAMDTSDPPPADDQACRLCHQDTEAVITFPSGETLPARVDINTLTNSAHGLHLDTPLACTSCHAPADYQFPHEPVEAADLQSYRLEQSTTCERCHQEPHPTSHPGPESENAVGCTNCHGAHNVQPAAAWEEEGATLPCAACHTRLGLEPQDGAALAGFIENGLFNTETSGSDYCLACHAVPNQSLTFENGDEISIVVTAQMLHDSVHGEGNEWQALVCKDCHVDKDFPHEPVTAETYREYRLEKYSLCARCHEPKYETTLDDAHGRALAEGNEEAAVCTDCHGSHDTPVPNEPRERISYTCRQCHSTIFEDYSQSVHGEALLGESNPDVPTCIECHGVHDLSDPKTALFRIQSPDLCATCHADEELMMEYDISTEVFETYVADFHGTTVTLFEQQSPDVETNKAVCYDCHGIHDIRDPEDPESGIKANLLATCQQCHPNATANFSDAWTSHYQPSLEHNALVFLVNWFYRIIIPATVGGLTLLVGTDVYRRIRRR